MKFPAFTYRRPARLAQALEWLGEAGGDAQLLAGGQSLLPMLAMRLAAPAVLIDLNGIAGLADIEVDAGSLRIGAMSRHAALESSSLVRQHAPLLALAVPHVAHVAVRHRGTIGGSLALADPAAELPACVLAMDGEIELVGTAGARRVPARQYFLGLYETARRDDEILTAVHLPLAPQRRSGFYEVTRRHGDYALAGAAVTARCDAGGHLHDLCIAMFGMDDRPRLATTAAALLEGQAPDAPHLKAASNALAADLSILPGILGSPHNRLRQAGAALRRAVAQLSTVPHA